MLQIVALGEAVIGDDFDYQVIEPQFVEIRELTANYRRNNFHGVFPSCHAVDGSDVRVGEVAWMVAGDCGEVVGGGFKIRK